MREGTEGKSKINTRHKNIPSQMCLNANAAAAAVSSDVLIPLIRTSTSEGRIESPFDEASSHFEYAPIVKHTENKKFTMITCISPKHFQFKHIFFIIIHVIEKREQCQNFDN